MTPDIDLDALARVAEYVRQYRMARGLDQIVAHTIHTDNTVCAAPLNLADLSALLSALTAALADRDDADAALKRLGDQANHLVQQLNAAAASRQRIAEAHHKHVDGHGGTWGECNECGNGWPCPTYVWATTGRDPLATWDPADDEAAGAGDGDWLDPSTPAPEEARVLHVEAGAGDGGQDACSRCGGLDGIHVHRDCPNARRDALKAGHDAWMAKYAVKGDGEQDTATTWRGMPVRTCDVKPGHLHHVYDDGQGKAMCPGKLVTLAASVQGAADGEAQA